MEVQQTERFPAQRHIALSDGFARIPTPDGGRVATLFEHGSLTIELYAPKGHDPQQPHTRDEAYIVVAGSGLFFNSGARYPFGPGDFLFAAAGEEHRFENFSDDLVVWVIFYGPEGGERVAGAA